MVVELHRYGADIPIFDGKYLPIPITDLIFHIPYFLKYKPRLLFLLSKSDQATNRRQAFNRARRYYKCSKLLSYFQSSNLVGYTPISRSNVSSSQTQLCIPFVNTMGVEPFL